MRSRLFNLVWGLILLAGAIYFGVRAYKHFTRQPPPPPPSREEVSLTIIPGWNLRQIADYLVLEGFASTTKDVFNVVGNPAFNYARAKQDPPEILDDTGAAIWPSKAERNNLSYEGYLAPETIRVFKDSTVKDVVLKFLKQRHSEIQDIFESSGGGTDHTVTEVITMASIVEEEAKTPDDRRMVADILWRRAAKNWALQVDSSVHYAVDKMGDVFTTGKEREVDSPWNTYKYPGLPIGPIANPSVDSIKAALNPTPNKYWYFLSGRDGKMYYAKTLDEHNANKKHL